MSDQAKKVDDSGNEADKAPEQTNNTGENGTMTTSDVTNQDGNSGGDGEERVITVQEYFETLENIEEEARMVYGGHKDNVCTFVEGYKPRQPLFSCVTCKTDGPAGVCYGCSANCHDGHELVPLYTKRRFKCDCGNPKFQQKCKLYEEPKGLNTRNVYNDNFVNKYCTCKKPYETTHETRGAEEETMYQCVCCEEWYHSSHIGFPANDEDLDRDNSEVICTICLTAKPFFQKVLKGTPEDSKSCVTDDDLKPLTEIKTGELNPSWRAQLCDCSKCEDIYDRYECDWIHDPDDSQKTYLKEAEENTKDDGDMSEQDIINTIAREDGPEKAIQYAQCVQHLKRNLISFFNGIGRDQVVTADHVKEFFSDLKRRRIDALEEEIENPTRDSEE